MLSKIEFIQRFMLNRARAIEQSLALVHANAYYVARKETEFAEEVWKHIEKSNPDIFIKPTTQDKK